MSKFGYKARSLQKQCAGWLYIFIQNALVALATVNWILLVINQLLKDEFKTLAIQ